MMLWLFYEKLQVDVQTPGARSVECNRLLLPGSKHDVSAFTRRIHSYKRMQTSVLLSIQAAITFVAQ